MVCVGVLAFNKVAICSISCARDASIYACALCFKVVHFLLFLLTLSINVSIFSIAVSLAFLMSVELISVYTSSTDSGSVQNYIKQQFPSMPCSHLHPQEPVNNHLLRSSNHLLIWEHAVAYNIR